MIGKQLVKRKSQLIIGAAIILSLVGIIGFNPTHSAFAEYACGTYGAGDYNTGGSCATTGGSTSSGSTTSSSKTTTSKSSTSSAGTPTTSTTSTPTTDTTTGTTDTTGTTTSPTDTSYSGGYSATDASNSGTTAASTSKTGFPWWIIGLIAAAGLVAAGIWMIVAARNRKKAAQPYLPPVQYAAAAPVAVTPPTPDAFAAAPINPDAATTVQPLPTAQPISDDIPTDPKVPYQPQNQSQKTIDPVKPVEGDQSKPNQYF